MAITQIESVNNWYYCCQPTAAIAKTSVHIALAMYVVNSMCCHNLIMATPPPPSQNYYAPQLGLHEGDDHHEAFKT